MATCQGVRIGDLAEQDARGRHELLKGEGATDQQTWKTQLTEHHPIEQAGEDHGQAAQATLEQAEAQQAWKR
jgi:hypothetical protein